MLQANQLNRFAPLMTVMLAACLLTVSSARPNAEKGRKNAAKSLAKEIELAQFHKIYVADFLDPSGTRTEKGCFFSSAFSTDLAKAARNFEVVNRIHAQKQLNELHIAAQDLLQPEMLTQTAQALVADGILVGTATITAKDANLRFSLREAASGKEVRSVDYHEKLEPSFESTFPAAQGEEGGLYYFAGLDGISQPKCIYCPNPDYTEEERQNGVQGSVTLSLSLSEKGAITGVRVVTNPNDSLTRKAVNILTRWRIEPSHDMNGNPVPVRVPVEIVFRLLS